jgi:hypothetical protein
MAAKRSTSTARKRKRQRKPARRARQTGRPRQSTTRKPRRTRRLRAAAPPPAAVQFAGFDTGSYPGDAAIAAWADRSPYHFVGFYFDSPCHTTKTFRTWSGTFPVIRVAGLGVAIVYVGLQQDGCGHATLSRAKGIEHGVDTIGKFAAEGFPPGAVVFLDIEHYNGALSDDMAAYLQGWLSAILDDGTITPGVYCPAGKVTEIERAAEREFAAHGVPGGAPVFWVVKTDATFDPAASVPAGSGVAFASAWQGRLDVNETHGGVTIHIDQNVADRRDPSRTLDDGH